MEILAESEWLARAAAHRERLEPVVGPHVERQNRHAKHPVRDFLFEYYRFPAAKLMKWHPGFGVALGGAAADEFFSGNELYARTEGGIALDAEKFPAHRLDALTWITGLLEKTSARAPRFACFGLHEWAMVYRAEGVRHGQLPLRMGAAELAEFVESQKICCTHFDAFRFFTPAARPLNSLQPAKPLIPDLEQGGCVHANMDLYKWAFKFFPWIGSERIADCFLLAAAARDLDMRASPYDCSVLGFEPVKIETAEGRQQYALLQRELSAKAVALRAGLLADYRNLCELFAV